jgi:Spy/CpxP family protein refolding chaperone
MTPYRLSALIPLVLVFTLAAPALAQGAPPATKRAQVEAKMKEIRNRMLREQVGLSEAKARQVEAILEKNQAERESLRQKVQAHRRAIGELLAKDSNDQPAYSREIKGMRDTQRQIQALRDKEIDELQKVLTPKEQAKLGVAMQQMKRRFNQAVRRHQGADTSHR